MKKHLEYITEAKFSLKEKFYHASHRPLTKINSSYVKRRGFFTAPKMPAFDYGNSWAEIILDKSLKVDPHDYAEQEDYIKTNIKSFEDANLNTEKIIDSISDPARQDDPFKMADEAIAVISRIRGYDAVTYSDSSPISIYELVIFNPSKIKVGETGTAKEFYLKNKELVEREYKGYKVTETGEVVKK